MRKKYITKEDVQLVNRCAKALYLKYRHPEVREENTKEQEAVLKSGREVGEAAWLLYNQGNVKGIDVSRGYTVWGNELAEATKTALAVDNCVLFEAGFTSIDGKMHCRADIILKCPKGMKLIEVKSGTSLKPEYILDAAFQLKVIKESGYEGDLEIAVAYINNNYVKNGPIDPHQLFTVEDVTERVKGVQELIETLLLKRGDILSEDKIPNISVGKQCWQGEYKCPFLSHCLKELPEKHIWNIGGIRKTKAEAMQHRGIIELKNIPKDEPLTEKQWIEVNAVMENKPHINHKEVQKFLDSLELNKPHYYMDFETEATAIPKYEGCKPYSNVCFQFCLLYKNKIEDEVDGKTEFLGNGNSDPRRQFIDTLLNATKKPGLIVVYNMSFEKTRLQELAALFPDLKPEINDRISRLRDLAVPFSKRHYYHPSFNGSHSLKSILPVLVSDLSYDNLIINNGALAMTSYSQLSQLSKLSPNEKTVIKEGLLAYCFTDVYSMYLIIKEISKVINQAADLTLLRKMVREVLEGYFQ